MAPAALREDTPLDAAEAARAAAALAELPRELRSGAFGGNARELDDLVARCVRGEPQEKCAAVLQGVVQWRAAAGADNVRTPRNPSWRDGDLRDSGCVCGAALRPHARYMHQASARA